eukprot:gb/GECH01011976.1/.p1 GENE.gb/GECH01011976.1/~~gb/GECH01011976.1/.p1  ORF type:complete len:264 (+),score=56.66 gb/GECH01011976.1/:1-792(+)
MTHNINFSQYEFKGIKKDIDLDPFTFGLVKARSWHFDFVLSETPHENFFPELHESQPLKETTLPSTISWSQSSQWEYENFDVNGLEGRIENIRIQKSSYSRKRHVWFSVALVTSEGEVIARTVPFKTRSRKIKPEPMTSPKQRCRDKTTIPKTGKKRNRSKKRQSSTHCWNQNDESTSESSNSIVSDCSEKPPPKKKLRCEMIKRNLKDSPKNQDFRDIHSEETIDFIFPHLQYNWELKEPTLLETESFNNPPPVSQCAFNLN